MRGEAPRPASSETPRARRSALEIAAASAVAASVVALGVYGLAFQLLLPSRLPTAAEWVNAAGTLARESRPGDAVALDPWWTERARQVLPATLPVLAVPTLQDGDLVGVRRLWVLSLPRAPGHRGGLEQEASARSAGPATPLPSGRITLTAYPLRDPVLPLAFLPASLATADVSMGGAACGPAGAQGSRCRIGGTSVEVAAEIREVARAPRRCIRATVPRRGVPLEIAFAGVPVGRTLQGHAGRVGDDVSEDEEPVHLQVKVEGRVLGEVDVASGPSAWRAFTFDTATLAGSSRRVSFTVTAADAGERELCFDAYTVP